jgi:hypothetical protein
VKLANYMISKSKIASQLRLTGNIREPGW